MIDVLNANIRRIMTGEWKGDAINGRATLLRSLLRPPPDVHKQSAGMALLVNGRG